MYSVDVMIPFSSWEDDAAEIFTLSSMISVSRFIKRSLFLIPDNLVSRSIFICLSKVSFCVERIADITEMILRVYISGAQLPQIIIGQEVKVMIDQDKKSNRSLTGEIFWISETAEFTPKIIQTKEERVNMVYALKVRVKNDGTLKIGMPGEVNF